MYYSGFRVGVIAYEMTCKCSGHPRRVWFFRALPSEILVGWLVDGERWGRRICRRKIYIPRPWFLPQTCPLPVLPALGTPTEHTSLRISSIVQPSCRTKNCCAELLTNWKHSKDSSSIFSNGTCATFAQFVEQSKLCNSDHFWFLEKVLIVIEQEKEK